VDTASELGEWRCAWVRLLNLCGLQLTVPRAVEGASRARSVTLPPHWEPSECWKRGFTSVLADSKAALRSPASLSAVSPATAARVSSQSVRMGSSFSAVAVRGAQWHEVVA
jgi:hypothetical protein